MTRSAFLRWAALLGIGTTGCGGSGSSGGGSNEAITDSARAAALDAIAGKLESLQSLDMETANAQMLVFLQGRSEFEATGIDVDSQSVWGRFRDGRLAIIANNRPFGTTRKVPVKRSVTRSPTHLPDTLQVRLLTGVGDAFVTVAEILRPWFESAGYTSANGDASVPSLRAVSGDALFYIEAHGGIGVRRDDTDAFSIWTATAVNFDNEQRFKEDLNDGSLAYMLASHNRKPDGTPSEVWHYSITETFVRKYQWRFGPNSMVFFTACSSASLAAVPFRDALFEAGVSVYVGWSRVVRNDDANYAVEFLMDRLLGANQSSDFNDPENPPQRPFPYTDILTEMRARTKENGLKYNESEVKPGDPPEKYSRLLFFENPAQTTHFAQFAPSIQRLYLIGDDPLKPTHLWIKGNFGQDPTDLVVTLGGQALPTTFVGTAILECPLPAGAPDLSGDCLVTVRGRKSNPVRLTLYKGTVTLHYSYLGNAFQRITANVHFLVDIHKNRFQPGEAPRYPQGGERDHNVLVVKTANSTANLTIGGSYHDDFEGGIVEWALNGPAELSLDNFAFSGEFDVNYTNFRFVFRGQKADGLKRTITPTGGSPRTEIVSTVEELGMNNYATGGSAVGSDYVIAGGERTIPASDLRLGDPGSFTLTWSDFVPAEGTPPNDAAGRKISSFPKFRDEVD